MSSITISDDVTGVDVTFTTRNRATVAQGSTTVGTLDVKIDQQQVELTDEAFRQLVDGLMDLRVILAEIKTKVQP